MAGKDIDLPSWLDYLSARLHDGRDHSGCSHLELLQVIFVTGAQVNAKSALYNNLEACQHVFNRLSISRNTEKQEVEVLEEKIGVDSVKPSTLVASYRDTLSPHPVLQLVLRHQIIKLL